MAKTPAHARDQAAKRLSQTYLARAESYRHVYNHVEGDDLSDDAAALLAIHAAIAVADAAHAALVGEVYKGQDHAESARLLRRRCVEHGVEAGGVKQVEWLVARKSRYSYGDKRVDGKQATDCITHSRRCLAWFYRSFPDVDHNDDR